MLLAKPSFLLRYAVRNYINLLNPKINRKEDVVLPKQALVHYIDQSKNVRFPTKDLYYFKDTPTSKKIRIQNVTDLTVKEGNPILQDKLLPASIRNWHRANLSIFRHTDIKESPVLDDTTVSMINYNAVKGAYRYTSSPMSRYHAYTNLQKTYVAGIKEVAQTHPSVVNIVPFYLPTMLYGYTVIRRLSEYTEQKLMRMVHEEELLGVIELFLWLDPKTRDKSVYKDITDEDSANIILAVEYKEHVVFLPLSILASLSQASPLASKLKKPVDKVQKMYTIFLMIVQSRVDKILAGELEDGVAPSKATPDDDEVGAQDENLGQDIDIDALEKEYDDTDADVLFAKDELDDQAQEKKQKLISNPDATAPQEEIDFTATTQEVETLIRDKPLDDQFSDYLASLVDIRAVNSTELRAVKKLIETRKSLPSPYDPTKPLNESRIVLNTDKHLTPQDREINVQNDLIRSDMKQNILRVMDRKYVNQLMKKDVLACVSHLEKSGLIIKSYEVDEERSKLGLYEVHRLVLKPLLGKESTVYFKLPVINEEGETLVSGVKVKLRKVKTDLPIRKVAPNRVALSSNYSKLFITRSEKKAYDYYTYITDYVKKSYLDDETVRPVKITAITLGNTFNNKLHQPNIYCAFAMVFSKVATESVQGKYTFLFSTEEAPKYVKQEFLDTLAVSKEGYTFCGFDSSNTPIVVDMQDTFHLYGKTITPIGQIEDILEIEREKLPVSFTNIKVLGKDMPLGIAFGYYMGLTNLIKITQANPTIIPANKQYKLSKSEYQLRFSDYKLIFSKTNREATLLLGGYLYFKDYIKEYPLAEFNKRNIYLPLVEERDFNGLYLKELDLLRDLFLDPITQDVLAEMHEPTEYFPLLLRANQMLTQMDHPDVNDSNYTRIRGYERIPGLMYRALSESIRAYKFKTNRSNKIELSPYAVWNNIVMDNSKKLTEDINPINDLKEMEAVTLVGQDGMSKEAISSKAREFTPSDMGVTSESTVDSSDTGVNTYLSPYARLANVRGMVDQENKDYESNPAKIMSTSSLLVPGANHDD